MTERCFPNRPPGVTAHTARCLLATPDEPRTSTFYLVAHPTPGAGHESSVIAGDFDDEGPAEHARAEIVKSGRARTAVVYAIDIEETL